MKKQTKVADASTAETKQEISVNHVLRWVRSSLTIRRRHHLEIEIYGSAGEVIATARSRIAQGLEARANLIAAAPETAEERDALSIENLRLRIALKTIAHSYAFSGGTSVRELQKIAVSALVTSRDGLAIAKAEGQA